VKLDLSSVLNMKPVHRRPFRGYFIGKIKVEIGPDMARGWNDEMWTTTGDEWEDILSVTDNIDINMSDVLPEER
jgi:hypothetical protein